MLKDSININTYLNILIAVILAFFGYIGLQYENRFDSIDQRFEKMEAKFDAKLDKIIELVYSNKITITEISAKQEHLESRISRLENSK